MSNMSITIRNQINAGSGKRAHPEHLKALAATKKEGQGRVRVEPTNEALRHVLQHPNGMDFARRARSSGRGIASPSAGCAMARSGLSSRPMRARQQHRQRSRRKTRRTKRKRTKRITSARQQRRASRLHQRDQCGRFRIAASSSVSASRASANSRDRNCSARSADASMCSTQARTIRSISASMRSTLP